jgi:hypothetical protein
LLLYTYRDLNIERYPHALDHLRHFRSDITCPEVRDRTHPWWSLHRPRNPEIFGSPKFIGLTTTPRVEVIYDEHDDLFVTDAMYVFRTQQDIDLWAFMALVQSSVFLFFYRVANQGEGRVIPKSKPRNSTACPFPASRHGRLVPIIWRRFAGKRLDLSKRQVRDDGDRRLVAQIRAIEDEIDRTVAMMYALSEQDLVAMQAGHGAIARLRC